MKKKNYLIVLFSIIITLLICKYSFSQVNQQWATTYNGPGDSTDYAISIAADGSGNVYTAGYSYGSGTGFDFAAIKYNSSGVTQWVARYNGPGDSTDFASSIAVDGSGNVYVTGSSYGSGTGSDFATIKYNSSGVQQWVVRYNGPGNSIDEFSKLVIDDSGNVYVTGYSDGSGTSSDFAIIKYNSSGVQQWVIRYNGTGNSGDYANSIAIDSSSNVYVAGTVIRIGTSDPDYVTIKYNSAGIQQWIAFYSSPGSLSGDYANSVAVDGPGNVFVSGYSCCIGTATDYLTIKYNSSGVQQWVARYNGPANDGDYESSIVSDSSGNVYVTGQSDGNGTGPDYATIKYNSSGVQQWVARYNGPANGYDNASSIAIDVSGNVYVTGSSNSATSIDYTTIKYNTLGDQQWLIRYNNGYGYAIAVDNSANVYVTGFSSGIGTDLDYTTIKYSQSTGIEQISSEFPEKFSLSPNYPNPFNPVTNLEFGISDLGFVSLKVYDILGKEIITLVNEKLSPGEYKVEFDGSDLPSGVYFYRLNAGEFTETKRMLLVK